MYNYTMLQQLFSSGIHLGILAMLGWGFSDFLAALLSRKTGSYLSFFWIMLFSLCSLSLFAIFNWPTFSFTYSLLFFTFAAGLLHTIAGLSFYKSLEIGKVSLVAPIAAAWSIVTVFGGIFLFQEKFSTAYLLPLISIILGTILVATDIKEILKSWKSIISDKGIPYALVAMLGWGLGFVLLNQAIKISGWLIPNLILFIVVSISMWIFLMVKRINLLPSKNSGFWIKALVAGILWSLAYISYSVGIESYSTSIIAPLGAAFPAVTIALATIFLKEKVNFGQMIGIASIMGGVILLSL